MRMGMHTSGILVFAVLLFSVAWCLSCFCGVAFFRWVVPFLFLRCCFFPLRGALLVFAVLLFAVGLCLSCFCGVAFFRWMGRVVPHRGGFVKCAVVLRLLTVQCFGLRVPLNITALRCP